MRPATQCVALSVLNDTCSLLERLPDLVAADGCLTAGWSLGATWQPVVGVLSQHPTAHNATASTIWCNLNKLTGILLRRDRPPSRFSRSLPGRCSLCCLATRQVTFCFRARVPREGFVCNELLYALSRSRPCLCRTFSSSRTSGSALPRPRRLPNGHSFRSCCGLPAADLGQHPTTAAGDVSDGELPFT